MDMLKSDVGKSFGKSGGEIIFVDGTLFRPKPTLAYNIEPEIIEKNIQIHRLVIGQGRLGSFDWLHELCNKTAGKEYITMTSRRIRKNTNSIYDPVSFFVNLNHKTINVLLTGNCFVFFSLLEKKLNVIIPPVTYASAWSYCID